LLEIFLGLFSKVGKCLPLKEGGEEGVTRYADGSGLNQEAGMETIKICFADDIEAPEARLERSVEDVFRVLSPVFNLAERSWKPQMDMNETSEQIMIVAEVTGVDKEDLEVEISSRAVRIRAMRNPRYCSPDATYRLAEIQYGKFERVLFLPAPIDPEIVSASYADGMLEIRLAKQPIDRIHKITVTEG
jgi:HSP20 family protein